MEKIKSIIHGLSCKVVEYYYNQIKNQLKEGEEVEEIFPARYRSMMSAIYTLSKTGFVNAEIENDKLFVYALNPMELISDNKLWDILSAWVKDKYNLMLAIGLYQINGGLNKDTWQYITSLYDVNTVGGSNEEFEKKFFSDDCIKD